MVIIFADGREFSSNTPPHQQIPLHVGPNGRAIIPLHLPPLRANTNGPTITITVRTNGQPRVEDIGKSLTMALGTHLRPEVVKYYYPSLRNAGSLPALRLVDILSKGIHPGEMIGFALHEGSQPGRYWLAPTM